MSLSVTLRLLSRNAIQSTTIATARSQRSWTDHSVNECSQTVTTPVGFATTTESTSAGSPALHVVLNTLCLYPRPL